MPADDPYRTLGLERGASTRRGEARVSAAGEVEPPRCGRRGCAAALPGDPGRVRPDRRAGARERTRTRTADTGWSVATPTGPVRRIAPTADDRGRDRGHGPVRAVGRDQQARRRLARRVPGWPRRHRGRLRAVGRLRRASAQEGDARIDLRRRRSRGVLPGLGRRLVCTTSGTYWTINPKGTPIRASMGRVPGPRRRAGRARTQAERGACHGSRSAPPEATITGDAPPDAAARSTQPPTHTTSSWWEATAGEPVTSTGGAGRAAPTNEPRRARPEPRRADDAVHDPTQAAVPPATDYTAADLVDAVMASIRGWLDDDQPTGIARIGRR